MRGSVVLGKKRLTIREVGGILGIPEATIQRWIVRGKIPAREDKGRYFFFRKDIEKWANSHNIFLHKDLKEEGPEAFPDRDNLLSAMRQGGIFFNVRGDSVQEVLRKAVSLVSLPPEVDRDLLLNMLLQREELASTGVGQGIAIPHPRYPLKELKGKVVISTFLLEKEIDFGSIDGIPVFVLFLMLSPEIRVHLRYLSKLSLCLRDVSFIALLKKCKKAEELFRKVEEIEKALPVIP